MILKLANFTFTLASNALVVPRSLDMFMFRLTTQVVI